MCCYRIYAWIWREDSNLLNSYVVLAKILLINATPPLETNENIHRSLHIRENFLDPLGILNVYYG